MMFVTMNQTTKLAQNGKTYHGGIVYEVPPNSSMAVD